MKEMLQTLFHYSPYSQYYMSPYHWQVCVSQFQDIRKG